MGLQLKAAVLGRPVEHSLSPVLHRAAYAALGLSDWSYERIDCGAADVAGLLARCGSEWAGFSVTMPGKRAALSAAEHVAPTAALVGAANTLLRGGDGTWTAENTDVHGVTAALTQFDEPADGPVIVLGAGGTAQAGVVALAGLGVQRVTVLVRDPARTTELRAAAHRAGVEVDVGVLGPGALASARLIISTVPAGAADFLADALTDSFTDARADGRADAPTLLRTDGGPRLLDAIYAPWPTALADAVLRAGGQAVGGREILLHQAAEQVRLMTGRAAPLEAMRAALDPVEA